MKIPKVILQVPVSVYRKAEPTAWAPSWNDTSEIVDAHIEPIKNRTYSSPNLEADGGEFMMITAVEIQLGDKVVWVDESYEAINTIPVWVFGELHHYETTLKRLSG